MQNNFLWNFQNDLFFEKASGLFNNQSSENLLISHGMTHQYEEGSKIR